MELQTESGGAETEGEPAESGRQRLFPRQLLWVQTAACFIAVALLLLLCEALIDVQTTATPTHTFYGMFSCCMNETAAKFRFLSQMLNTSSCNIQEMLANSLSSQFSKSSLDFILVVTLFTQRIQEMSSS